MMASANDLGAGSSRKTVPRRDVEVFANFRDVQVVRWMAVAGSSGVPS